MLLTTACAAHTLPPDSSVQMRVAVHRPRLEAIATCPPDASAVTVAQAMAKPWVEGEKMTVVGQLTVVEDASCTKKGCSDGGCCNSCRFGPEATWRLSDAHSGAIDLRGWSMTEGKHECDQVAVNIVLREMTVVITAEVTEAGPIPQAARAGVPEEALPVVRSICRVAPVLTAA